MTSRMFMVQRRLLVSLARFVRNGPPPNTNIQSSYFVLLRPTGYILTLHPYYQSSQVQKKKIMTSPCQAGFIRLPCAISPRLGFLLRPPMLSLPSLPGRSARRSCRLHLNPRVASGRKSRGVGPPAPTLSLSLSAQAEESPPPACTELGFFFAQPPELACRLYFSSVGVLYA